MRKDYAKAYGVKLVTDYTNFQGKTIKKVDYTYFERALIIYFTDETVAVIEASVDPDSCGLIDSYDLMEKIDDIHTMREFRLITEEEFQKHMERVKQAEKAKRQQAEYQEYLRLQEIYG